MRDHFFFFKNFFKNPLQNAAILPSSRRLAKEMVKGIDFSHVDVVVELWPGNGSFTEKILKNIKKGTKVILIEIEKKYVDILQKKYGNKVIIECDSAHLLDAIMKKYNIKKIDLIVSWLPFVCFARDQKDELFQSIKRHTQTGTIFRNFTYRGDMSKKVWEDYQLPLTKRSLVLRNIPPAWVCWIN